MFICYRCSWYKLYYRASHSDNLRAGIPLTLSSVDSMLENQGNRSLTSVHDGNLKIVAVEECWEVYLLDDSRSHQIDKTYHHTADNRTFLERNSYKVWPSLILEAYKERHWFTRDLQIKQDHQSFFLFLTEWMNVHDLY